MIDTFLVKKIRNEKIQIQISSIWEVENSNTNFEIRSRSGI